ncbi:MAG: hypothetical protein ACK5LC_10020, partial [Coprobacillaceae bacterium]
YKNPNSQLIDIHISDMIGLTNISDWNIDFMINDGQIEIYNTPSLVEISNISTSPLNIFSLNANNILNEVKDMINSNAINTIDISYENGITYNNNLINNYTYEDAVSKLSNQPIIMNDLNITFNTYGQFEVIESYVDTISISSWYYGFSVTNSVVRNISDISITLLEGDENDYVYCNHVFSSLLVDSIGALTITASNSTTNISFNIVNVTANDIGERNIKASYYFDSMSQVVANNIGAINYEDIPSSDENSYGYFTVHINQVYAENVGEIDTHIMSPYAHVNIYYYTGVYTTVGGMDIKMDHQNNNFDASSHTGINLGGIEAKTVDDIFVNATERANVNSNNSVYVSESNIDTLGSVQLNGDSSSYNLYESIIKEIKDISINGLYSDISINNQIYGRMDTIGDITVTKRELSNNYTENNTATRLYINSSTPIQSIGNIYLDSYGGTNNASLEISNTLDETMSIDSIGDIYANKVTDLNLANLKIKSLGELNLPVLETIDLSGNELARLKVKDNVFPNTLTSYNFNGNQIAGLVPVSNDLLTTDYQLHNFFDTTQDTVEDQSQLYILVGDKRYENTSLSSDNLYTINVSANETLSVDTLINLVRMNNGAYDDENENLFSYHTWKYGIHSNTNTRASTSYSDEITLGTGAIVEGLNVGDNYIELSLYDAVRDSGKNENAKVYFKVVKQASPDDNQETDNNQSTNVTPANPNQTTSTNSPSTGDYTNVGIILFILGFIISGVYVWRKGLTKKID